MRNKTYKQAPEQRDKKYTSYSSYRSYNSPLIPRHGGYRKLESYKNAVIIYDGTISFCKRYKTYMTYKTYEQMIGAARSGKQNIAEGSQVSGTSKKSELKLIGIARASLEELLQDFLDFLRQNGLELWEKDDPRARKIRALAYRSYKSYKTYKPLIESSDPEEAANTMICLIHQTNYLLDNQIRSLERQFLKKGGFTENLYQKRRKHRGY